MGQAQLLIGILAIIFFLFTIESISKRHLREEYAILWLSMSLAIAVLSLWTGLENWTSMPHLASNPELTWRSASAGSSTVRPGPCGTPLTVGRTAASVGRTASAPAVKRDLNALGR